MVKFKIYVAISGKKNNCNTNIVQNFKKQGQSDQYIWSVNTIKHERDFSSKILNCRGETSIRPFSEKSKMSMPVD